jgi:hypothetical protein
MYQPGGAILASGRNGNVDAGCRRADHGEPDPPVPRVGVVRHGVRTHQHDEANRRGVVGADGEGGTVLGRRKTSFDLQLP